MKLTCQQCDHKWAPRKSVARELPRICPMCKSARWDERREGGPIPMQKHPKSGRRREKIDPKDWENVT